MCGRYVALNDVEALRAQFNITETTAQVLEPNYNTAPSQEVYIIVDTDQDGHGRQRRLEVARWGLVPSWAKDQSMAARTINARAETVGAKPVYRSSFARRRCLVPVRGIYEWQASAQGPKQPYFLCADIDAGAGADAGTGAGAATLDMADAADVGLAGLYSWWRDPGVADVDDPAAWLLSMSILTMAADPSMATIHDRMPIPVPARMHSTWLDPHAAGADVLPEVVSALPARCWTGYPVSRAVNNVRANGQNLAQRI
jgi:putative SOS response-associated peptidase YedK